MPNAFVIIKCVTCTINGMAFRAPTGIHISLAKKNILVQSRGLQDVVPVPPAAHRHTKDDKPNNNMYSL